MAVVDVRHGFPEGFGDRFDAMPRSYNEAEWNRWRAPQYSGDATFPHCDANILHHPGECAVCDLYPDRQSARVHDGIAFTGHEARLGEETCPADQARPPGAPNWHGRWGGNVPPAGDELDPV